MHQYKILNHTRVVDDVPSWAIEGVVKGLVKKETIVVLQVLGVRLVKLPEANVVPTR